MTLILSGTNGLSDVNGSAATPAIRGTDSNTGMFFPAADTIAFAEGGAEVMRIDSSGNVGIGTSSPGAKLNVAAGDAASAANQVNISGGRSLGANVVGSAGSILFTNSYWTSGYGAAYISGMDSGGSGGLLAFATTSNGGGTTGVPTERARIASDGKFTLATETLYITNIPTTSTAGNCLISSGEGNKFYRSTSSLKYKRNVVDMQRGVQDVMQLRPVNFNGVSDFDGDKLFAGFIAEEVESLGFKEFVIYDDKGDPDGLQYANMVALLTKAIQEQQALITSLTARIAALEGAAS
jgi:hypothetical protein